MVWTVQTIGTSTRKGGGSGQGKVRMVRVNIDQNQQIAAQLRVQSVPTVYAFFNGQPVDAFTGAQPESAVTQFVQKLAALSGEGPDIAAMIEEATVLVEAQDFEMAMAKYHEIMAADPESPEGLGGMIRCFVGMRDIASARDIVDQLDDGFREKPAIQAAVAAVDLAEKAAGAADGIDAAQVAVEVTHRIYKPVKIWLWRCLRLARKRMR